MKKIIRRNHIRENFRANLLQEQVTPGDVADIFIPGVSAYKNFKKGDIAGGLIDAGLDVASLVAGGLSGGLGYGVARGLISAVKAGNKLAKVPARISKSSRVPNTGYGPWGRRPIKTSKKGGKKDADTKRPGKGAGAAAGAAAVAAGGGAGGSSDIYGKDRPQTGFRDRYQGINPYRSGELRQNIPFYDTPVGGVLGRRAMMAQAIGRVPQSSLPEEKVYSQLQEMVNKSIKSKEINNILVTQDMAKNIVQLHEALNTNNKKLLEESIQSKDGFFEVLDFSVRN